MAPSYYSRGNVAKSILVFNILLFDIREKYEFGTERRGRRAQSRGRETEEESP